MEKKESTTFTIDGVEFSYPSLSLGTLLLINEILGRMKFNMAALRSFTLMAVLAATQKQPGEVCKAVALFTIEGKPTPEAVADRCKFLREHCEDYELATLLIGGILINDFTDKPMPDLTGLTEDELWDTPFNQLIDR